MTGLDMLDTRACHNLASLVNIIVLVIFTCFYSKTITVLAPLLATASIQKMIGLPIKTKKKHIKNVSQLEHVEGWTLIKSGY